MKKRLHIVLASALLVASMAACNSATGIPEAVSNGTETTAQAETDRQEETSETKIIETLSDSAEKNGNKEAVGLANPWRDISYDEANETVAKFLKHRMEHWCMSPVKVNHSINRVSEIFYKLLL